ncbi:MAG: GHMP kinase, partial [Candidatus Eisenbacteria bacterium]|nr:GHMP kinase [Candidatus Latescibacterota bacterium]MBD3301784.1 GHMP kinase [Candidatus Eisenbacteria bacterium]
DRTCTLASLDFDLALEAPLGEPLPIDGRLDLLKGVVNRFQDAEGPGAAPFPCGFDLMVHSDAPPGSGLGASSTLVTALVGLLREWIREPLTNYEIAELTYRIERIDLEIAGGRQDQYAATFGGFNFIEFHRDHTIVNPLRIRRHVLNELEYAMLLCYTGTTRLGANIVVNQMRSYRDGKEKVVRSLDRMKELTLEMKAALLRDRVQRFGELLHEAWEAKKDLDPGITNPEIDRLYAAARGAGAIGGKILGAGGGGYILVFCPIPRRQAIARALEEEGGTLVPFAFEERGLQTWTVPSEEETGAR